jgi:malic enzyme
MFEGSRVLGLAYMGQKGAKSCYGGKVNFRVFSGINPFPLRVATQYKEEIIC